MSDEHDLTERLKEIEKRVFELEKMAWEASVRLKDGVATGPVARDIEELKRELRALTMKTTKWEGGGSVIYIILSLAGGVVGWILSHLGFGGALK